MERYELLNLLYVERQRLSEQNSQTGWSVWILIGGVITLSWMLIEHYETVTKSSAFGFCWSQVITLFGDFITIAFAILIAKNYYSDKEIDYRSNRFHKSKLPVFLILDITMAVLYIVLYSFFIDRNTLTTIMASLFLGIKCQELQQYRLTKQITPLLFKQCIYIFIFVGFLSLGGYRIYIHSNYYIANTKYALLLCGIIILLYILFWYKWSTAKQSIIAIDKLVDSIIINESINMEQAHDNFISIKFGYRYSQLFGNKLQEIPKLLETQEIIIIQTRRDLEELKQIKSWDIDMLNKSVKLFYNFQKQSKTISHKIEKIRSTMIKDLKNIPLTEDNKIEIEKISEIVRENISKLDANISIVLELSGSFHKILDKPKEIHGKCSKYYRFVNSRFSCCFCKIFCISKKQQSNIDSCSRN